MCETFTSATATHTLMEFHCQLLATHMQAVTLSYWQVTNSTISSTWYF